MCRSLVCNVSTRMYEEVIRDTNIDAVAMPHRQKRNPGSRKLMVKSVSEVVRSRLDKGQAAARIKAFSLGWVPVADQPRFIEVVETELLSLHEGNIARYRLRPVEFHDWQQYW